jgi:hypothetical protein
LTANEAIAAMRIIGNIEHPVYKITVFKMDNRLSLKVESGLYEQTYKFRDGEGVEAIAEARALVDAVFLERVEAVFARMRAAREEALARGGKLDKDGAFEEII